MDELVKSIDALSRDQLAVLANRLGLGGLQVPVLLPGARPCLQRKRGGTVSCTWNLTHCFFLGPMLTKKLQILVLAPSTQPQALSRVCAPSRVALFPGAKRASVPLAPELSEEDRRVVDNVTKIVEFLARGPAGEGSSPS